MISIYYQTAHKIGYTNPPPARTATLKKDQLAYAKRTYIKAGGFSERTVGWEILIDEEQILSDDTIRYEYIIAHELAHVECAGVVGGGGDTSDGEQHGAAFLACWLHMLLRLGVGVEERAELARWHARRYELLSEQLALAIKAADHDTPYAAASAAAIFPSTPLWQNTILIGIALAFATYFLRMIN
jgi:hypothetical protein